MRALGILQGASKHELLGELPEKKGTIQPCRKFLYQYAYENFAAGLIEKNEDGTV